MKVFRPRRRIADLNGYHLAVESDNPIEDIDEFNKFCEKLIAIIEEINAKDADN